MSIIRKDVKTIMGKPDILKWLGDLLKLKTKNKTSIVDAINEQQDKIDGLSSNVGDKNNLTTVDKTSTVNAINETVGKFNSLNNEMSSLKSYVSDGKSKIAAAITGKGQSIGSNNDSWFTLAWKISCIDTGKKTKLWDFAVGGESDVMIRGTDFKPLGSLGLNNLVPASAKVIGIVNVVIDSEPPIQVYLNPEQIQYYRKSAGGDDMYIYIRPGTTMYDLLTIEFDPGCCTSIGAYGQIAICEEVKTVSSGSNF